MRSTFSAIVLILITAQASLADPPRTEIAGGTMIAGHEIRRMQLLVPLVVNDSRFAVYVRDAIEIRIPPGTFTPVSEDKGGVYFQSGTDFARLKFPGPVPGGIYVSKKKNRQVAYLGDARAGSGDEIERAKVSLTADQSRALRFESSEKKKK